jgi:hypothetical protein
MGTRGWLLLAAGSLGAAWLLFLEYLPPFQAVSFPGDIAGYHYPLLSYAWQELKSGRLPLWDPVIYCGISFTGATQTSLFYPPNWLLFAAAAVTKGMLLKSLEALLILHLWAGFLFCFGWLRERTGSWVGAFVGAAAFALGGMPLAQSQHLGVVCCYAWIPLGLWAVERKRWLALAAASAMAFLAGYPPTFVAFAVCVLCWAAAPSRSRLRNLACCAGAMGLAMLLAAVQLLPALVSSAARMQERSYGGGLPSGWMTYLLLLLPKYTDGWDYFYVGGAAVAGLAGLARVPRWTALGPPLLTLGTALLLIENPLGAVGTVMDALPNVAGIVREYNLLPCVTVAVCCLAAHGCAHWAGSGASAGIAIAAAMAWCGRLLWLDLASGWWTLVDAGASAVLAWWLLRAGNLAHLALVVLTLVELKSFGTNRPFSADRGHPDKRMRALRDVRTGGHALAGLEQEVFERIRRDKAFRVVVVDGMQPLELHHYGLASPQGFEASLPARYREKVAAYAEWRTNRLFEPPVGDERFLQDFAVKYAICRTGGDGEARLKGLPHWRALGGEAFFLRVYEYAAAQPAYRADGDVAVVEWAPGRRVFEVSGAGGELALLEQHLPGWQARVDGQRVETRQWGDVFQKVSVPAGRHRVDFEYRPADVLAGAWISAAALAALVALRIYIGRSGSG